MRDVLSIKEGAFRAWAGLVSTHLIIISSNQLRFQNMLPTFLAIIFGK